MLLALRLSVRQRWNNISAASDYKAFLAISELGVASKGRFQGTGCKPVPSQNFTVPCAPSVSLAVHGHGVLSVFLSWVLVPISTALGLLQPTNKPT